MRTAWAIVAGIVGAAALAWWLARDPGAARSTAPAQAAPAAAAHAESAKASGPTLYRWRDEAGVVQVTDIPPRDRDYTVVDVGALERRNIIDPDPAIEAAR
ncbi:DUF4124 domain-containing protein [Luteimonas composti]|uniref:DUF4124 domain-containing protein n=1 Tax=Luteimonas composti TaxID=398257 RepID=A0ABT6MTJ9_9GAMM|nr:DUF4124 domain-containing protein [Luteimonas composti]MDH7453433.1 DUF4124 domain-containing protein [Luteimonas composti]